jgi:hypothetical protein
VLVYWELCRVLMELWETAVLCEVAIELWEMAALAEICAEGVGCIGAPAWKAPAPVAMILSTRKSMSSYRENGVVCQCV